MKLEHLPFDTKLFGYPVYSFRWNQEGTFDFKEFEQAANESKSHLTYVFSKYPLNDVADFPLRLVDCKLTLRKSDLETSPGVLCEFDPQIDAYEELLALAFVSGEYSRFCRDEHFSRHDYERLYKIWLDRSLDGSIAETVVVVRKQGHIAGFATAQRTQNEIKIGLLAVSPSFQRQGVGAELLRQVESFAIQSSLNSISTQTQNDNLPAVHFYKKHGYRVTDRTYVYHYWQT